MEVMNSSRKKRTILAVSDSHNDLTELCRLLSERYDIITADSSNRDFRAHKQRAGNISAAVICVRDAAAEDYSLFKWLETDSMLAAIPMLIYCGDTEELELAGECLKRGAVDIIAPPLVPDVIFNRISNAIRLRDSATFYEIERMLKELPSNIYLKDAEGRYIFATHYWHHLDHSDDPTWTIRGKTDIEIRKDKENAVKAMATDMDILRTGKGMDYIIEINTDGVQEFLELIKRPVRDNNGKINGIIALINYVTEQELLRISLEEKALKDELTGADNRRSFDNYIKELAESGEEQILLISADCNDLKQVNDTYGHLTGDEYIRMAMLLFRTVLPEESRIFRVGGDEFIIVMPSVGKKKAKEYVEKLKAEEGQYRIRDKFVSISYGVACLGEDASSVRSCIEVADKRMYNDKNEYKKNRRA